MADINPEAEEGMSRGPIDALALGCTDKRCDFKTMNIHRKPVGDYDVLIDMKYCGICHSDVTTAARHLAVVNTDYPCVPGHELAGVVEAVGPKVTKFKVGQQVGVGCMTDSCKKCKSCKKGNEHKCSKSVMTYNGRDNGSGRSDTYETRKHTLGGYTTKHVCDEDFAISIPDSYPLEAAGPIMCAGVTMYQPMKDYNVKEGTRIGIVGLGGLGVIGIKLAKAIGATVTAISRSKGKEQAAREYGATNFLVSTSAEEMEASQGSLDLIINTVPAYHDYLAYNPLLSKKGKHVLLGLHKGYGAAQVLDMATLGMSKLKVSLIGSIAVTQEVMDLCSKNDIRPNTKIVSASEVNEIFAILDGNNDASLRYVMDIATLTEDTQQGAEHPVFKPHVHAGLFAILAEFCGLCIKCKWC